MRLHLPGSPHLSYCTNIHAGERWAEIEAALRKHVLPIKAEVSPDQPMGIGLRLSATAADELAKPEALAALKAFLAQSDLYVFTINAFPYGNFHGTRVKERVYEPDWRDERRVLFSNKAADILEALLPEGVEGSISTVPGAYKDAINGPIDIARMVYHLIRHAAYLYRLAEETGKHISLALEPEPCCFLETIDEAIDFFNDHLFARQSVETFRRLTDISSREAREALRRHLGICLDVCHASVEFEDPVECLGRLAAVGIKVPKIQLSSALRIPVVNANAAELLARFDDGVYLHQTVEVQADRVTRYRDLPEAFDALRSGRAGGEWRVHCHVPLFQADYGALQSTQQPLANLLAACKRSALAPHLEVETYTWDVLPADMRGIDVSSDIARELKWVRSQLGA
ncbi:metabolite traffic protein EboE [Hyphomicrobium sp. NDB2Meth4]|uniref:metabolite traffic protein EboE n=1 Tax=Hyphomicrobium sp. NDB2Meth4 TaxID=1892846 RepID=UPI000931EFA4|nr:metabolite traffic protein EboE [Hyphomicrobium sp. NDB2Meth4]